jgi:hypothetical protein
MWIKMKECDLSAYFKAGYERGENLYNHKKPINRGFDFKPLLIKSVQNT